MLDCRTIHPLSHEACQQFFVPPSITDDEHGWSMNSVRMLHCIKKIGLLSWMNQLIDRDVVRPRSNVSIDRTSVEYASYRACSASPAHDSCQAGLPSAGMLLALGQTNRCGWHASLCRAARFRLTSKRAPRRLCDGDSLPA